MKIIDAISSLDTPPNVTLQQALTQLVRINPLLKLGVKIKRATNYQVVTIFNLRLKSRQHEQANPLSIDQLHEFLLELGLSLEVVFSPRSNCYVARSIDITDYRLFSNCFLLNAAKNRIDVLREHRHHAATIEAIFIPWDRDYLCDMHDETFTLLNQDLLARLNAPLPEGHAQDLYILIVAINQLQRARSVLPRDMTLYPVSYMSTYLLQTCSSFLTFFGVRLRAGESLSKLCEFVAADGDDRLKKNVFSFLTHAPHIWPPRLGNS